MVHCHCNSVILKKSQCSACGSYSRNCEGNLQNFNLARVFLLMPQQDKIEVSQNFSIILFASQSNEANRENSVRAQKAAHMEVFVSAANYVPCEHAQLNGSC